MNESKTIGVKQCSMTDRKKIQSVCDELGVETYKITEASSIKNHPDLRLATDNVVENTRDLDEETVYVTAEEFVSHIKEKFSKN